MSFSQAMQPPGAPQPQQNQLVGQLQQTAQAVESMIQKLRTVPGINQQALEQGVQKMKEGMQMIVGSMPKGGGGAPR